MAESTAYTLIEQVELFKGLAYWGVNPTVFSNISERLKKNPFIKENQSYDPGRLSPDALRNLYSTLLKEQGGKGVLAATSDEETRENVSTNATNPRKRKIPSPQENPEQRQVLSEIATRLYRKYKETLIKSILEDESKYTSAKKTVDEVERGDWDARLEAFNQREQEKIAVNGTPSLSGVQASKARGNNGTPAAGNGPNSFAAQTLSNSSVSSSGRTTESKTSNYSRHYVTAHPGQTPSPLPGQPPVSSGSATPKTTQTGSGQISQAGSSRPGTNPGMGALQPSNVPPKNNVSTAATPSQSHAANVPSGSLNQLGAPSNPALVASPQKQMPLGGYPPRLNQQQFSPASQAPHGAHPIPGFQTPPSQHPTPHVNPQTGRIESPSKAPTLSGTPRHPGTPQTQQPFPYPQPNLQSGQFRQVPPQHITLPPHVQREVSGGSAASTPRRQSISSTSLTQPQTPGLTTPGRIPRTMDSFIQIFKTPRSSPAVTPAVGYSPFTPFDSAISDPASVRPGLDEIEPMSPGSPPADLIGTSRPGEETVKNGEEEKAQPNTDKRKRRGQNQHTKAKRMVEDGSGSPVGQTPASTSSVRGSRRSQSILSNVDIASEHGNKRIKHEQPATPSAAADEDSQMGDTTADESGVRKSYRTRKPTAKDAITAGVFPPSRKRRRSETTEPEPEHANTNNERFSAQKYPNHILSTRNFPRTSAPIISEVARHKFASLFQNPVKEKDAPGYHELIHRPQDIKSIKTAINLGGKAVIAAVALEQEGTTSGGALAMEGTPMKDGQSPAPGTGSGTPSGVTKGNVSSTSLLIPKSEDLLPPNGIVNSAQLEKEVMRMFANAVMFNPDPDRGVGQAFAPPKPEEDGEEDKDGGVVGYEEGEEGGVVKDTREMFAVVDQMIGEWRGAERTAEELGGRAPMILSAISKKEEEGEEEPEEDKENEEGEEEDTEKETKGKRTRRR
jgi:Bromodomain